MRYTFTFRQNEHNYLVANRLRYWGTLKTRKTLYVIATVAGFYLLIGGVVTFANNTEFSLLSILSLVGIAMSASLAILILCYAVSYALLPSRTRKLLAQQKLLHLDQHFEITENSLNVSSDLFNTTVPYTVVYKWAENSKTFLLYHTDMTFQFFPKDEVPAQAIEMIKAQLIAVGCPGKEF